MLSNYATTQPYHYDATLLKILLFRRRNLCYDDNPMVKQDHVVLNRTWSDHPGK
jgi:hypothetical protein